MKFDMKKCLQSFSLVLDLAEFDYFKTNLNHSRRTAYISLMIARSLNLSKAEQSDLYALSVMHDNGVASSTVKNIGKAYELFPDHCLEGEKNIKKLPLLAKRENVIKYHHENYDGTGIFGISNKEVPFFSEIIHVADSLDNNFILNELLFKERKGTVEYLKNNSKTLFNPLVVESVLAVAGKERFWADLAFYNIEEVLNRIVPAIEYEYDWENILGISEVFSEIIDSKSRFTRLHSKGIADKVDIMCGHYNVDADKGHKLRIASNLHDLGKLYVPNEILDKPGKLNEFEFHEIKQHTYYTKLALDKIPGFEDISSWAANHHEKLNGRGYPEGIDKTALDFESRLIGVIDIYQALTEERPYRKGLAHETAIEMLRKMAAGGFIDGEIVRDVDGFLKGQKK